MILKSKSSRQGVVLLVVIAMLTLFAAVGLSFVYYAQAEAAQSRTTAQAFTERIADIDPQMLLSYFLGQYIFDLEDKAEANPFNPPTNHNVYSSMRGHSLGRNMYGWNRNTLNITPFNGISRNAKVIQDLLNDPNVLVPHANLVNYRYFPNDGPAYFNGVDFIRDPGRYGSGMAPKNRDATMPGVPLGWSFLNMDPTAGYADVHVGHNVPWTYADTDNMYLGQLNNKGEVVIQSFWRDWTVNATLTDTALWAYYDQANVANAPAPWKKYASMRPLPWYNRGDPNKVVNGIATGSFPGPADGGGDVKNLDGFFGVKMPGGAGYFNNDSIWIDLGYPIRMAPNGKLYKPLFAAFIVDLDGKVNLSVSGNARGVDPNTTTRFHASSAHGWGP